MTELTIELKDLNTQDFYGNNNINLKLIQTYFPKLKIVVRGKIITAVGNESILELFDDKINQMINRLQQFNQLTVDDIEHILTENATNNLLLADDVIVHGVGGKLIKAITANQKILVELAQKNDMIFANGPAGTGKTYTSVALAVRALKNREVKRIVLTRPAVEAGENLGFLPGDLKEKLDPYLQPLYDALRDMIPFEKLESYLEKKVIEVAPLAFMRGRTLDHAYVILDEAQNTTNAQMKMFLTRMGKDAKFIITGDPTQVDLPKNQQSGLKKALDYLKGVEGIGFVTLDGKDVVRHRLVKRILERYEEKEPNLN